MVICVQRQHSNVLPLDPKNRVKIVIRRIINEDKMILGYALDSTTHHLLCTGIKDNPCQIVLRKYLQVNKIIALPTPSAGKIEI